jgi:hypothetical protein
MFIATLTTDFGLNDFYVAMLKGTLLQQSPGLQIVDISHNVQPYDIVQGAFVLKNAYHAFPQGSIHLIHVNNYSGKLGFLAFRHRGHYFIGPDNGIFSLMFDEMPQDIFRIECDDDTTFLLREVFARAVSHLASGKPVHEIGIPAGEVEKRITLQPVISASQIRGSVIYIDHYENVVVNIVEDLFERVRNGRNFSLFFKRNDPITKLNRRYHDVPVGEVLCLFNSTGYLEIAINMGKASSLLGLNLDDMVQVDFHG